MRLVVDTGIFSASLSTRRRPSFEVMVKQLSGNQLWLAVQTEAELRFGAMVAGWGEARRSRLEESIATTTVVPISDALIFRVANLRHACQVRGLPLASSAHANDLWIAASAIHIGAALVTADRVFDGVPGLTLSS